MVQIIRVLLIDDDEDDYLLTSELFRDIEGMSYSFDWTASYEEGLAHIRQKEYDVYLVDYRLGDRTGLDLVREVLADGDLQPMILLTGQGDRAVDLQAMEAGAADYLIKGDISPILLERSIRYAIKHTHTLNQLHRRTTMLELRNKELDAFSHTVAHDLRAPLAIIMGYADLLTSQEGLDSDVVQSAQVIFEYTQKMDGIIDAMLLLAGLRKVEVSHTTVLMQPVIEAAVARFIDRIEERKIRVSISENLPAIIGYAPWVEEVVANLIDNAIKYIGRDNPDPTIQIDALPAERGLVRYEVQDNGIGIKAEDQEQLFELFSRFHEDEAVGHGLGMSIVQRIMIKLGGQVGVESEPGRGSTFWFTLPAA